MEQNKEKNQMNKENSARKAEKENSIEVNDYVEVEDSSINND